RNDLYRRIDQRVELMIDQGLVEEVRGLLEMGYDRNLKPMQALGYRHVLDYLEGAADLQTIKETLKRDTRRYAKRQLTWFRADPEINWVRPDQEELISGFIRRFTEGGRT
ncbi:MAG: tRNA (adenosine(37)-N6)-dimethylallyltransferase MiaA, partial [Desulfosalsimonas sp.]